MRPHWPYATLSGALILFILFFAASPVDGTWSIVIADFVTKEVGTGMATCVDNADGLELVPIVLTGIGAGAVQAARDGNGVRRMMIREELLKGTHPEEMIDILADVFLHEQRQYGIVDTRGRAATFSGFQNGQWAGGLTGRHGTLVYAIQGNVLAGECVVGAIEDAILSTDGDVPAKLMAAMLAARAEGGDGRCSCGPSDADTCGCPVPSFTKSSHIGYMVVTRAGDTDDPVCDALGCADGDYFLALNVAFQMGPDLDPVLQLQGMFNHCRAELVGRPDAVGSRVDIAASGGAYEMTIELADWQNLPITEPILDLAVTHESDSVGITDIGPVRDLGVGRYSVTLTPTVGTGLDRYRVTVDDGIRPVVLMPVPELCFSGDPPSDCNGNGLPDVCDADCDGDGVPDECEPDDCDSDGTPDDCEVDCNDNGVPDHCESFQDCNANDLLDECDITTGTSTDCNDNGVPDECEGGELQISSEFGRHDLCGGEELTLSVTASGIPPIAYQWRKDGENIPGGTEPSYTISRVVAEDAGTYDAVVTNSCGSLISDAATLSVTLPPALIQGPREQVACVGGSATFAVVADGTGLFYQWWKDGIDIPGANLPSYTIDPVAKEDVGLYGVYFSNPCGFIAGGFATLQLCGTETFLRGDANDDGQFNGLADSLYILAHQFSDGPPPSCLEAADADGDATFNGLVDALYVLGHQFQTGAPPPPPYPACGMDPEPETSLGCDTHDGCG